MAEVSVVGRELAQQIADRGAEPPSLYFHDEENMKGIIEGNLRSINLTQVDISLLNSNSPAADDEARKLFYALSTHGYFFAMNHGMSGDFIEQVRSLMNEFFMLPIEEKLKLKSNCVGPPEEDGNFDGYGFEETTREGGPEEWCDRLSIMISPLAQRKMQYWPDKPVEFGKIMEECSIKAEKLVEQVLIGMARSLNLADEKSFVEEIGSKPQISARFNFYPKCSRPDRVLGLDSHSDGSVLTFLVQDKQVEGLQLLLDDGEWVRVPTTPSDALVISIGDQGEVPYIALINIYVYMGNTSVPRGIGTLCIKILSCLYVDN
ncbi:Protein SRG1 [Linum perenne]